MAFDLEEGRRKLAELRASNAGARSVTLEEQMDAAREYQRLLRGLFDECPELRREWMQAHLRTRAISAQPEDSGPAAEERM